ncbi:uncharacterized protein DS421_9g266580 [Arachis hypogaea]|nr:uncharacterized protein DS421_9g266580 [Arachis hypogaea]
MRDQKLREKYSILLVFNLMVKQTAENVDDAVRELPDANMAYGDSSFRNCKLAFEEAMATIVKKLQAHRAVRMVFLTNFREAERLSKILFIYTKKGQLSDEWLCSKYWPCSSRNASKQLDLYHHLKLYPEEESGP